MSFNLKIKKSNFSCAPVLVEGFDGKTNTIAYMCKEKENIKSIPLKQQNPSGSLLSKQKESFVSVPLKQKEKNLSSSSNAEKTKIYLFKAEWCGHCNEFKPIWNKLKQSLKKEYIFVTLDADEDEEEMKKWDIKQFPTIIKIKNNKKEEYNGSRDEISIKNFIIN